MRKTDKTLTDVPGVMDVETVVSTGLSADPDTDGKTGAGPRSRKEGPTRRARAMEAKKQRILDGALDIFSQYGLYGASLDQIAERADVSKTNLLYYYPSKDVLYLSVLKDLLTLWLAPLRALNEKQEPLAVIADYIRLKLRYSRTHPKASRLFSLEVLHGASMLKDDLQARVREVVDEKVLVIRSWVANGKLAPVDPYHLLFSLWAITQHYADFSAQIEAIVGTTIDDDAFFEDTVREVQRLILHGIAPVPTTPDRTQAITAPHSPQPGTPATFD
ncbi:MAG: HTH-type transcriptional regulator RutR [Janthinobacterium lividum]